jgi:flagellar biosynthesis/type III secretory pathway protein FliH
MMDIIEKLTTLLEKETGKATEKTKATEGTEKEQGQGQEQDQQQEQRLELDEDISMRFIEGFAEGFLEGFSKGRAEVQERTVKALIIHTQLSAKKIASILSIPRSYVKKLALSAGAN